MILVCVTGRHFIYHPTWASCSEIHYYKTWNVMNNRGLSPNAHEWETMWIFIASRGDLNPNPLKINFPSSQQYWWNSNKTTRMYVNVAISKNCGDKKVLFGFQFQKDRILGSRIPQNSTSTFKLNTEITEVTHLVLSKCTNIFG